MKKTFGSLEEILKNYESVVLDTSAMISPIGYELSDSTHAFSSFERDKLFEENHLFREELKKHIKNHYPIFVTKSILKEFRTFLQYNYQSAVGYINVRKDLFEGGINAERLSL